MVKGILILKNPSATERGLCRNLEFFSELNRVVNRDIFSFTEHHTIFKFFPK